MCLFWHIVGLFHAYYFLRYASLSELRQEDLEVLRTLEQFDIEGETGVIGYVYCSSISFSWKEEEGRMEPLFLQSLQS